MFVFICIDFLYLYSASFKRIHLCMNAYSFVYAFRETDGRADGWRDGWMDTERERHARRSSR